MVVVFEPFTDRTFSKHRQQLSQTNAPLGGAFTEKANRLVELPQTPLDLGIVSADIDLASFLLAFELFQ